MYSTVQPHFLSAPAVQPAWDTWVGHMVAFPSLRLKCPSKCKSAFSRRGPFDFHFLSALALVTLSGLVYMDVAVDIATIVTSTSTTCLAHVHVTKM